MSHIDARLDVDNAVREFVDCNADGEDFILYFRHSYKDGEGNFYTNGVSNKEGVPAFGNPDHFQVLGNSEMYDDVRSVILSLAAGLLLEDKDVKKQFFQFVRDASR